MPIHRQLAAAVAASVVVSASAARIPLDDFRRLHAAGAVLTVDVRDPVAFRTGHIPGAVNIPLGQLEARAGEIRTRAGRRPVVTYCACLDEHASLEAVEILNARGLMNVSALAGGLRAWIAAGGKLQS
ncbi:MAG TPA: rhodanese-like domain-containing protein [Vicinamibacterales bacterium]|nr:rhodanese-like domain-containing protein [Vicinamibacterales bacterium]